MKWLEKLFKGAFSEAPSEVYEGKNSDLPIDEAFVNNFKNKGGIFIYIENPIELPNILQTILLDKGADSLVFSHNEQVEALFSAVPHTFFTDDDQEATHFLTVCEYLVAEEGSLLFSSRQLGQKHLDELPQNLVVVAKISQIVATLFDAMGGLNRQTQQNRPNNIRTLRAFLPPKEKDSILYENCYRTTYLLLLEDLNTNE